MECAWRQLIPKEGLYSSCMIPDGMRINFNDVRGPIFMLSFFTGGMYGPFMWNRPYSSVISNGYSDLGGRYKITSK